MYWSAETVSPKWFQIVLIDVWECIRRGLHLVGQEGLGYDGQTHRDEVFPRSCCQSEILVLQQTFARKQQQDVDICLHQITIPLVCHLYGHSIHIGNRKELA
jgi:hypothetical protein